MKKIFSLLLVLLSFITTVSSQEMWKEVKGDHFSSEQIITTKQQLSKTYKLFKFDLTVLNKGLSTIKSEQAVNLNPVIVKLPTPLGVQRFSVKELSVLSDELSVKYPEIKSYVGIGIDDSTARVRFSKGKDGFHAMISSVNYPLYLVDPYTKDKTVSIAYSKNTQLKTNFECLVDENINQFQQKKNEKIANANDGKLRTYRLALVGTGEYSQFHLTNQNIPNSASDTEKKLAVLSAMNTTMTRVNGVFERDLGVTMVLVTNNTDLIFLDATTDDLTDDDANSLIDESQVKCDAIIGTTNYDIGHTFSTGGGGLAGLGVACIENHKAKGVTGSSSPINDTFDIDYVAHEIGHQFGANHTQNNDCNRNDDTAVEPGSASTIMGYAGICSPNVQNNSDAYFHTVSITEMWNHVSGTSCAVESSTGNSAPIANAGNDVTIPKSTPFVLKGTSSDVDAGNTLTHTWEQIDNESATMAPVSTNTAGPLFRSISPTDSPNRYMPELSTVLSGNTSTTWEVLPSVSRTMQFAFTVRDNATNGGATARDDKIVTVDANSGPFIVTSQAINTTLFGGSTQTITWDVANTSNPPISSANVNILLSTDGGLTYPNILISNTPNDGSEDVVLTNITTAKARIMVESADNIFYAVNTTNFSIDRTTSVDDNLFANFQLYPNPTKGIVKLVFDVVSLDEVRIQLFDIRGRLIDDNKYKVNSNTFQKQLNYQSISQGVYVLKVSNGNRKISKKIVVE